MTTEQVAEGQATSDSEERSVNPLLGAFVGRILTCGPATDGRAANLSLFKAIPAKLIIWRESFSTKPYSVCNFALRGLRDGLRLDFCSLYLVTRQFYICDG